MPVDLARLPAISFAPTDAAAIEAQVLAAYESRAGVTLQPGDPARLFLESLAYYAVVLNGSIDLAGKQNLLAFASGAHLDHLGALMGVSRIPAQNSLCLVRFAMSEALNFAVPIPAGTRVASRDGKFIFATLAPCEIAPGALYADAAAAAAAPGSESTGLAPGQIASLVDPIPYIVSVSNLTATTDGADIEADDRLRERIRLAPEAYTVAGSSGEYEARALAASADIESVSVHSPEPGVVDIRFTLTGGELPDAAMIALVEEALSSETVRPLTDLVLVGAPDPVGYAIFGGWFLSRNSAPLLAAVTAAVNDAVEQYRRWQNSRPGRDIVPSRLIGMVMAAGAKRVELQSPIFTRIAPTQIARDVQVHFVFMGMEDE